MENLELSLSSLGIISRHVDKSHNELNQFLAKQVSRGPEGASAGRTPSSCYDARVCARVVNALEVPAAVAHMALCESFS